MKEIKENQVLRILVLGDGAVGKKSLVSHYKYKKFGNFISKHIIGFGLTTSELEYQPGKFVTLEILNRSGAIRFQVIIKLIYNKANAVMLMFDLTRKMSWDNIPDWLDRIQEYSGEVPIILVGNKLDLMSENNKVINRSEIIDFAKKKGFNYIETSAKTGENIDEAFLLLTKAIISNN